MTDAKQAATVGCFRSCVDFKSGQASGQALPGHRVAPHLGDLSATRALPDPARGAADGPSHCERWVCPRMPAGAPAARPECQVRGNTTASLWICCVLHSSGLPDRTQYALNEHVERHTCATSPRPRDRSRGAERSCVPPARHGQHSERTETVHHQPAGKRQPDGRSGMQLVLHRSGEPWCAGTAADLLPLEDGQP